MLRPHTWRTNIFLHSHISETDTQDTIVNCVNILFHLTEYKPCLNKAKYLLEVTARSLRDLSVTSSRPLSIGSPSLVTGDHPSSPSSSSRWEQRIETGKGWTLPPLQSKKRWRAYTDRHKSLSRVIRKTRETWGENGENEFSLFLFTLLVSVVQSGSRRRYPWVRRGVGVILPHSVTCLPEEEVPNYRSLYLSFEFLICCEPKRIRCLLLFEES